MCDLLAFPWCILSVRYHVSDDTYLTCKYSVTILIHRIYSIKSPLLNKRPHLKKLKTKLSKITWKMRKTVPAAHKRYLLNDLPSIKDMDTFSALTLPPSPMLQNCYAPGASSQLEEIRYNLFWHALCASIIRLWPGHNNHQICHSIIVSPTPVNGARRRGCFLFVLKWQGPFLA